ncbi:hypothetical protein ACJX0J_035949 [Zea mays]
MLTLLLLLLLLSYADITALLLLLSYADITALLLLLSYAENIYLSVAKNGGLGGGALWDEDTFVISLEEGHYAAYIKNYMAMQIIFGSGVATGREEEENKCATLDFYGLFETDIILFLVCAYDANLKQVSFIVADNLILALLLIVADNLLIVADNLLIIWLNILYNLKTVLVGSKNMKTEIYTIPQFRLTEAVLVGRNPICSFIWQRSVI